MSSTTPSPEWAIKALSILDIISVWTLGSLAIVLGFLLFCPYTAGVDLSHIRKEYGGWLFVSFAICAAMTIGKLLRHSQHFIKRKSPNFIVTQQPMKCWWHAAQQKDGSYATQLVADCNVLNMTPQNLDFHSVRLISPRRTGELIHATAGLFNEYQTQQFHIFPNSTEWVRLSIMLRGRLGEPLKPLKVTVGLTDNLGVEQKVKLILRPAP